MMICDYCGADAVRPYKGRLILITEDGSGWQQMFFVFCEKCSQKLYDSWRDERASILMESASNRNEAMQDDGR